VTIHPAMATYAFSTRPLIQEPSNETANDVKQVCFADDSFADQGKASRHFAQPSLLRFGEKNAKTKTYR